MQTKPLKFILDNIIKDGLPSDSIYEDQKSAYLMFLKIKEEFADKINAEKKSIRSRVFSNRIDKEKFKIADNLQRDEQAFSLLLDIDNFLDKEHKLKITFDNEADFNDTINNIKQKFELFIYT